MSDSGARMPRFIAVGPPRTATTWLDRVLRRSSVCLPQGIKETNFFAGDFSRGMLWYQSHFIGGPPRRLTAEICPQYFDHPQARERIAFHIPSCRIVCTLRDPVRRLYSHYRHLRCTGWLGPIAFEEALRLHHQWIGPGNMLGASMYAAHLVGWQNKFGKENVLVLLHDDLDRNPQEYLDRLCAFADIPAIDLNDSPISPRVNARSRAPRSPRLARLGRQLRRFLLTRRLYRVKERLEPFWEFCSGGGEEFEPLDSSNESRLRAFFRPDIEALEQLIERDLSAWRQIGVHSRLRHSSSDWGRAVEARQSVE